MFEHIMIGVDGHDGGRDAIALARRLSFTGGELTLAHVYSGDPRIHGGARAAYQVAARARSRALLDRALEDAQIDAGVKDIEAPSVGRGLHELTDREGADLLVLGSCCRGPLGRVLVGDDTAGALHGAPCAVAVAPAGYRLARGAIREIGVAYDGSSESLYALDAARELAHDLRATLSAPEVAPATTMRSAEELSRYSASLDLLVVGSRGYRAIGRLIHGSASSRLARTAHCPLLVLPRADRNVARCSEILVDTRGA